MFARLEFVHPEHWAVSVALYELPCMRTMRKFSAEPVDPLGMVPLVSLAALSFPPAVTAHGSPVS
jgi:hypothetical protein